jgi:hypothetical protein
MGRVEGSEVGRDCRGPIAEVNLRPTRIRIALLGVRTQAKHVAVGIFDVKFESP